MSPIGELGRTIVAPLRLKSKALPRKITNQETKSHDYPDERRSEPGPEGHLATGPGVFRCPVAVVGGGCSGFQYAMNLERQGREGDDVLEIDGFKVFVDPQSMLYLDGTEIDYIETTQAAGFQFKNPNVSGSCGCGESFHV